MKQKPRRSKNKNRYRLKPYRLHFERLKKNTLFKMLLFYCAFTFIIIYSVTAIQMHYSRQKLQEKIYDSHISGLRAMQVYSDINIVQKINDVLLSLQIGTSGRTNIRGFATAKEPINEREIYNTYTELEQVIVENPVISSIELYNKYSNLSLSSSGGVSFYKTEPPQSHYFTDERGPMWTQADGNFISVVSTFPLYAPAEEKVSSSVIRLDKTTVKNLLDAQQGEMDKIDFYICDSAFQVLAGTDSANITKFPAEKMREGQSVEIQFSGESRKAFYVGSAYGDWNYVYTISNQLYQKELNELNLISFWNVLAMTAFSFCGLVLISMWLYRPIREMLDTLKKHFKSAPKESDIAYISEEVRHLIRQVDDVNAIVKQNEPLIVGHLIMETVYGAVETRDLKNRLKAVDAALGQGGITPVAVNINEQILKQLNAKQQSYLLVQVSELMAGSVSEKYPCIATKISYNNVMAFVLCAAQDLSDALCRTEESISRFGLDEINIIIGQPEENAERLGQQCRQLLQLTKYDFVYGYANILYGPDLAAREQKEGRAPEEIMPILERLLKKEDLAGAASFVDNLYAECMRESYSCEYIQQCFFEMLRLLARFSKEHGADVKMTERELSDMHAVYEYVCQSFESLEGEHRPDSREEILVRQVKEFIAANVEHDVSQGRVAQELNVSTAHLSRIFKKITGEKFSDYVTEAKLTKAAQMLLEHPEMTIARVAEHFGYYNMNYFNTLFKKRFLMTPSQYRKR